MQRRVQGGFRDEYQSTQRPEDREKFGGKSFRKDNYADLPPVEEDMQYDRHR